MVTSIEKSGKNRPRCDTQLGVLNPEHYPAPPHCVHVVIGVNLSVREVLVLSASSYKCDFLLHRSYKRMADRFEVAQVFTPLSNPWVCGSLSSNWLWQRHHSPDCLLCETFLPADVAPLLALEKRLWGARSQDPQFYSCRVMNSAGAWGSVDIDPSLVRPRGEPTALPTPWFWPCKGPI